MVRTYVALLPADKLTYTDGKFINSLTYTLYKIYTWENVCMKRRKSYLHDLVTLPVFDEW